MADQSDDFRRQDVYPKAENIFQVHTPDPSAHLADGVVVLDTSILLLPYQSGQASLAAIADVFQRLKAARVCLTELI